MPHSVDCRFYYHYFYYYYYYYIIIINTGFSEIGYSIQIHSTDLRQLLQSQNVQSYYTLKRLQCKRRPYEKLNSCNSLLTTFVIDHGSRIINTIQHNSAAGLQCTEQHSRDSSELQTFSVRQLYQYTTTRGLGTTIMRFSYELVGVVSYEDPGPSFDNEGPLALTCRSALYRPRIPHHRYYHY